MEKKFVTKSGGCICGEIKFQVKLDEIPKVFNCHCIDCRKKIGGMITIILLRDNALEIDKSKNPVFKNAQSNYFLALNDGVIVGRVAVMINWVEVNQLKKKKVRFGWFDVVDDINVTIALMEKVYNIGNKNNKKQRYKIFFLSDIFKHSPIAAIHSTRNTFDSAKHQLVHHFVVVAVEKESNL